MHLISSAGYKPYYPDPNYLLIIVKYPPLLGLSNRTYRKVSKFSDARKLCCNPPKIQTKRPNLRVLHQNSENGIANSEDLDQTAPLGAV